MEKHIHSHYPQNQAFRGGRPPKMWRNRGFSHSEGPLGKATHGRTTLRRGPVDGQPQESRIPIHPLRIRRWANRWIGLSWLGRPFYKRNMAVSQIQTGTFLGLGKPPHEVVFFKGFLGVHRGSCEYGSKRKPQPNYQNPAVNRGRPGLLDQAKCHKGVKRLTKKNTSCS